MAAARRTPSDNERRVRELADTQHGVVSRAQVRELGISDAAINRRTSAGLWSRALPGVFRITGTPMSAEQLPMAATLWAGEGAVVSHATAARLWGLEGARERKVELWVPSPRNPRHPLVDVHRALRIDRADRARLGTLPITTPVRTLIDVSSRREDDRLLATMDAAFRRGLVTPERLGARLAALRSSGGPGAGRLEALLRDHGNHRPTESRLESKIWLLLSRSALPRSRRQHWVSTPGGRYRLDFAWPERKLGLECDGWEHHGGRIAFGKDRERLSELVSTGWRVLVVTWDLATRQPRRVVRWVELAIAA